MKKSLGIWHTNSRLQTFILVFQTSLLFSAKVSHACLERHASMRNWWQNLISDCTIVSALHSTPVMRNKMGFLSHLYKPDEICSVQGLWLTFRALRGFSEDSALSTLQTWQLGLMKNRPSEHQRNETLIKVRKASDFMC